MSLILKLEAMPGDRIEDTCHEMVDLADRLNIVVKVEFNDVTLMSYWGGDPCELAKEFSRQLRNGGRIKFASTHGGKK